MSHDNINLPCKITEKCHISRIGDFDVTLYQNGNPWMKALYYLVIYPVGWIGWIGWFMLTVAVLTFQIWVIGLSFIYLVGIYSEFLSALRSIDSRFKDLHYLSKLVPTYKGIIIDPITKTEVDPTYRVDVTQEVDFLLQIIRDRSFSSQILRKKSISTLVSEPRTCL